MAGKGQAKNCDQNVDARREDCETDSAYWKAEHRPWKPMIKSYVCESYGWYLVLPQPDARPHLPRAVPPFANSAVLTPLSLHTPLSSHTRLGQTQSISAYGIMDRKDPLRDILKDLKIAVDDSRDRVIIGLDFGTTYSGSVKPSHFRCNN
jgi:hypothetical protein